MIEFILPGGTRRRWDHPDTTKTVAQAVSELTRELKLKGAHRLRSAEGVLNPARQLRRLPDPTTVKLEPKG